MIMMIVLLASTRAQSRVRVRDAERLTLRMLMRDRMSVHAFGQSVLKRLASFPSLHLRLMVTPEPKSEQ